MKNLNGQFRLAKAYQYLHSYLMVKHVRYDYLSKFQEFPGKVSGEIIMGDTSSAHGTSVSKKYHNNWSTDNVS